MRLDRLLRSTFKKMRSTSALDWILPRLDARQKRGADPAPGIGVTAGVAISPLGRERESAGET